MESLPLKGILATHPLLSLSDSRWLWGEKLCSAICSRYGVLPHHRPKGIEPNIYRLKSLKPWTQINLFSFELFISGILQWWKADWDSHHNPQVRAGRTSRIKWFWAFSSDCGSIKPSLIAKGGLQSSMNARITGVTRLHGNMCFKLTN
jgi:hypothetical protein